MSRLGFDEDGRDRRGVLVMVMIMVTYSIMGAFIFQFQEASREVDSMGHNKDIREHYIKIKF